MLKFIKHHLTGIDGIEIYPMISLIIFFSFFVVLFIWVITAKKKHVDHMSNLPFDAAIKNDKQHTS